MKGRVFWHFVAVFVFVFVLALGGLACPNSYAASITPFTNIDNGISAAFSSSGDPGGFSVVPSFFSFDTTGNVLEDPGPAGLDNLTLTVAFSEPITNINLDFALNTYGVSDQLTLSAYSGTSSIGSNSATGTFPVGYLYPEGTIGFSYSSGFDSVVLSSNAQDFAVDNIAVTTSTGANATFNFNTSSVPEPSTILLFVFGLLGLGAFRMKSKTA